MQRGDAHAGSSVHTSDVAKPDSEAVVDVVASNAALGMAARWLGMSADEARQEMATAPNEEDDAFGAAGMKRPRFLGLGAKYLPHHKNVQFVAALDGKLRRRLQRSRNDKGSEDDAGDNKRGDAQKAAFGGRGGWTGMRPGAFPLAMHAGAQHGAAPGDNVGSSSGSDSDEGKSSAFKCPARRIVAEAVKHPVGSSSRPAAEEKGSAEAPGALVNGHTMGHDTSHSAGGMTAKEKHQMLLFAPVQADLKAQGKKKKKKNKPVDATR